MKTFCLPMSHHAAARQGKVEPEAVVCTALSCVWLLGKGALSRHDVRG